MYGKIIKENQLFLLFTKLISYIIFEKEGRGRFWITIITSRTEKNLFLRV